MHFSFLRKQGIKGGVEFEESYKHKDVISNMEIFTLHLRKKRDLKLLIPGKQNLNIHNKKYKKSQ